MAIANATVEDVGTSPSWGNFIKYRINNEYEVFYAHLDKVIATEGKAVKKGEVIARTGNTGNSTGAHLHFTIFKNSEATDPLPLFDYKTTAETKAEYIARGELVPDK